MKKIYQLVCTSLFLVGSFTACDDGSLSHDEVSIPDPVEQTDADDGYSPEPTTDAIIRVLPQNTHQEIDGFGCSFGWAEAVYGCTKREALMDDLYGENGLRFNIYRGEICNTSASADGKSFNFHENDNYHLGAGSPEMMKVYNAGDGRFKEYSQLWIIDYLTKRKLKDIYYFFSVWSPPVVWKSFGDGENPDKNSGSFNYDCSEDYSKFLVGFAKTFKDKFGINVYGMSGWNEPDQAMGGWEGCLWTNKEMADFTCDYLRPGLDKAGLTDTKIIYGEMPWWANAVTWVKNALEGERGQELVDAGIIAAGHGYSTVPSNILSMEAAEKRGVHVWQTETCDDKTRDETWNDAMKWAEIYHGYLTRARTNAIVWWAGARYCTSTGENLLQTDKWDFSSSFYRVDRYYSIGQYSRYIKRGSIRVDTKPISGKSKLPRELSTSAYVKQDDNTYTIVIVNNSKSKDFEAQVEMEGKEFESMISYTSSASVKWLRKKINPSLTGKRTVTVPKYSVVTITGTFKEQGQTTE